MVMKDGGMALMGLGKAAGENRVQEAVEQALKSPLLDNNDISDAKKILVNVSSGKKNPLKMEELGRLMNQINEASGKKANFKRGVSEDLSLDDESSDAEIAVTIIATGFSMDSLPIDSTHVLPNEGSFSIDEYDRVVPLQENQFDLMPEKTVKTITVTAPIQPRTSTKKSPSTSNTDEVTEEDITHMQNVPAFMRAGIEIATGMTTSSKDAKYRLDESDEIHKLDENSLYLNED
jgi:cell division protein FtsZ